MKNRVVVAVTNNKGGVGKTHTAFHLAGAYAEEGKRVLAIDLDAQGNLTGLFLERSPRPTLFDVLTEQIPLEEATHSTAFEGITIVPASKNLEALDGILQNEPDAQVRLATMLQEYLDREDPDYVLLDCPPSLGLATRNALACADRVIIPLEADRFSVTGLRRLLEAIEKMRQAVNPRLAVAGLLISLFDMRRSIEAEYEAAIREQPLPVFATKIKNSAKYREAITARKPITHYKPRSEYADAFRELLRELEGNHAVHERAKT